MREIRECASSLKIIDCTVTGAITGPSFRSRRLGPEWDLIEQFLEKPHFTVSPGHEAIVFIEPQLQSGFPDLVIVIWDKKRVIQWHPDRKALTRDDVRVAQYMYNSGPSTDEQLGAVFPKWLDRSLARLDAAGVVRARGGRWHLRPLSQIFAAQQIIAVEAKISEWKVGLNQAVLNTWFASASYLLVPEVPRRSSLIDKARALGIGIWTKDQNPVKPEKAQKLPRSYASWLFNEWAWRASAWMA
jgi:hypothetical protein